MTNSKLYDLEERTLNFSKEVRKFVKLLPKSISNLEDGKQVIRSSGSIGANYIEANEALGKKDFILRTRISRKEAKETRYWLELIDTFNNPTLDVDRKRLLTEVTELLKILSSIINKSK
jgi:four helix bundle protein